jgi:hypothetical protein
MKKESERKTETSEKWNQDIKKNKKKAARYM